MRASLRTLPLVAVFVGLVTTAVAQSGPLDGKFVATEDGSTWVILGSIRHQIQPVLITESELAQFSEGEPVSVVAQLEQRVVPAALGAPAPSHPPAALLGQVVKVCNDGVPFIAEVVEADWTKTLGSGAGSTIDGGMWVSMVVSVSNNGPRNESLYRSTQLHDERGRTWGDIGGTASAVHTNYEDLAVQRGAQIVNRLIRPGIATRVLLVYNAAEDALRLDLRAIEPNC